MKLRWFLTVLMAVFIFLSVGFVPAYASIEEVPDQPVEATPSPVVVTPTPSAEPSAGVSAVQEAKPISVDGTGTVVDAVTDADGKEFYTITTEAGNVFFLIIDHQKDENNVYFLNAVTEEDLMALAVKSEDSGEKRDTESAVPTAMPAPTVPVEAPADAENPEDATPDAKTGGGSIALIIIAVIAVGGAGYYFKIYKPKKEASNDDEEYDPEYEDEPDAPDEQDDDFDREDDEELNE